MTKSKYWYTAIRGLTFLKNVFAENLDRQERLRRFIVLLFIHFVRDHHYHLIYV